MKRRSAAQIRATRKLVAFNKARRAKPRRRRSNPVKLSSRVASYRIAPDVAGTARRRRYAEVEKTSPSRRRNPRTVTVKVRARRRRNPLQALIANPSTGYTRAFAEGYAKAFGSKSRKRKTTTKGSKMAKRRRKRASTKRRASPRRRRRSAPRRAIRLRGRRKAALTVYANPRRRRRSRGKSRRRVHRRRNPGMGGGSLIKRTFTAYAAGFVTSAIAAVVDKKLAASHPNVARIAKVLLAFGVAKFGRRHPQASAAAIGALAASEGYNLATRALGGMAAAPTPAQAVQGIAEMSDSYPEMGALLNGGMGALLNGVPNVDNSVTDYTAALANIAGTDDDY